MNRRSTGTQAPQALLQYALGDVYTTIINNQLYLGIWGNSNSTTVAEWVQVRLGA